MTYPQYSPRYMIISIFITLHDQLGATFIKVDINFLRIITIAIVIIGKINNLQGFSFSQVMNIFHVRLSTMQLAFNISQVATDLPNLGQGRIRITKNIPCSLQTA